MGVYLDYSFSIPVFIAYFIDSFYNIGKFLGGVIIKKDDITGFLSFGNITEFIHRIIRCVLPIQKSQVDVRNFDFIQFYFNIPLVKNNVYIDKGLIAVQQSGACLSTLLITDAILIHLDMMR